MRVRWFLNIPFLQSCLQSSKFHQLAGLQQIYSLLGEPRKNFHYCYCLWQAKLPPPPFFLPLILLLSALTEQVVSTQVSRDTHHLSQCPRPLWLPLLTQGLSPWSQLHFFALNKNVFKPTSGKKKFPLHPGNVRQLFHLSVLFSETPQAAQHFWADLHPQHHSPSPKPAVPWQGLHEMPDHLANPTRNFQEWGHTDALHCRYNQCHDLNTKVWYAEASQQSNTPSNGAGRFGMERLLHNGINILFLLNFLSQIYCSHK